jgi:hypothetical protein
MALTHVWYHSTRAVVCHRDGQRCLLLRVADLRQKEAPLIACSAKLYLLHEHTTLEGEVLPYHCEPLALYDVRRLNGWQRFRPL